MSQIALNCIDTVIFTRQENPAEAALCAERLGWGEEAIPELMSLKLGEAIVKQGDWELPVRTRIDKVELGDPLTQQELEARYKSDYDRIRKGTKFTQRDSVIGVCSRICG